MAKIASKIDVRAAEFAANRAAMQTVVDDLRSLDPLVTGDEVEYALTLPGEGGETEVFFSDLSHEYVTINAEYTT